MSCKLTLTQFWQNAVVRAAIATVVVPVIVYVLNALGAMWGTGTFHGDYVPILAGAAALLTSLLSSFASRYFPIGGKGDPNSGSFTH